MLFEGNSLRERQEELKRMSYIDYLEETGKVYVGDLSTNEIEALQTVLSSLGFLTSYKNDYLLFNNREEKREVRINEVKRKMLKNKGGSGGYTYRVSIPVDFIRELGLEDEEHVVLSLERDGIVIRKIQG